MNVVPVPKGKVPVGQPRSRRKDPSLPDICVLPRNATVAPAMRTLVAALVMIAVSFWGPATRAADYPADNSGKNVRDRQESSKTPGDQSNSKSDVAITQAIRKAVVADKALSTKAHNVKIITADGVVTLRGPVNSSEEKDKIASKAKSVAGVKSVENKLEIASR